jgi:hypothetical protein
MIARFKAVPPDSHLLIPLASRKDARAGVALFPACRTRSLVAQRLAWIAVSVAGARVLPLPTVEWRPPFDLGLWQRMRHSWKIAIGDHDGMVVHQRRPAGREGFSVLLLKDGAPVAFVKVRPAPSRAIENESRALEALAGRLGNFSVPRVLDRAVVEDWCYLAIRPQKPMIHSVVARDALRNIGNEIAERLGSRWDRPTHVSQHWVPIHGDLTPWNLRKLDRSIVLFDWEEAGWGPPGADELWYDTAVHALGLGADTSGKTFTREAYEFWLDKTSASGAQQPSAVHAHLKSGMERLR